MSIPVTAQWSNADHQSVVWTNPDGTYEARLITEPELAAWLTAGGVPDDARGPGADPRSMFSAAITAGCQIVSTANPTISATYAIDDASIIKYTAIATGINAGRGLPSGEDTMAVLDISSMPREINAADFLNLAAALSAYIYQLISTENSLLAGLGGTWPTLPVTIP